MNRASFLLALALVVLTLSACSTHRSLTMSADGTVSCTRSRDVSEHLGGLASLLTPSTGTAPTVPGGGEDSPNYKSGTSIDLPPLQAAVMQAEAEARRAEAEAQKAKSEAAKAAVEACAQIVGG